MPTERFTASDAHAALGQAKEKLVDIRAAMSLLYSAIKKRAEAGYDNLSLDSVKIVYHEIVRTEEYCAIIKQLTEDGYRVIYSDDNSTDLGHICW